MKGFAKQELLFPPFLGLEHLENRHACMEQKSRGISFSHFLVIQSLRLRGSWSGAEPYEIS